MASNHLYLVDGSGYIFRAYHQLPPLTNRHGLNVGAVYGYTAMLWKLADALHKADGPSHLAVVLDKGSHTFRNDMYDQYKAHRPPPPEDLVPQFPLIRTATRAFSLPCIEEEGFEADDIIATYTCRAVEAGWSVTIVSSDKDLAQLIIPGQVDMLDTMKNERRSSQYVIDKFGVGPERLGDVLALMGDSVDNVPGVPGIGPKTASKLITEHGDLEGVLAAIPAMKPSKMRENLENNVEMARLSRKLVALHCDMPLPQDLDSLKLDGIPPEPLREFLEDQGFKTLLSRLTGERPMPRPVDLHATPVTDATAPAAEVEARTGIPSLPELPPIDCTAYQTISDEAALDAIIAEAYAGGLLAIDTETDALDSVASGLVGISLATAPGRAAYIPVAHVSSDDMFGEKPPQLPLSVVVDKLLPVLSDPAVLKIGHNIKYDINVLARHGLVIAPYDDTMVISFDLDSGKMLGGHGMDVAATTHLAHTCTSFKDVTGTGKKQISFAHVPLDRATAYAAEDADVTFRLWTRLKPRLAHEAATRVYELVDRPLIPVVAGMERAGIKVDRHKLAQLSSQFTQEMARLEEEIYAEAGHPFTIGSPQQLGVVLFDEKGLKGGRRANPAPTPRRDGAGEAGAEATPFAGWCSTGGRSPGSSPPTPRRCRRRSTG